MTEQLLAEVFSLEARVVPDPVFGTPLVVDAQSRGHHARVTPPRQLTVRIARDALEYRPTAAGIPRTPPDVAHNPAAPTARRSPTRPAAWPGVS